MPIKCDDKSIGGMRDAYIEIPINNGRRQGPVRAINTTGKERPYPYGGQYYEMSERYRNDYGRDAPYSNRGQDSWGEMDNSIKEVLEVL